MVAEHPDGKDLVETHLRDFSHSRSRWMCGKDVYLDLSRPWLCRLDDGSTDAGHAMCVGASLQFRRGCHVRPAPSSLHTYIFDGLQNLITMLPILIGFREKKKPLMS